jgi:hypothetical protein
VGTTGQFNWRVIGASYPNLGLAFHLDDMEDLKYQLQSLLGRPEIKRSTLRLDDELLRDPKVVTAIVGLLLILAIVYCKPLLPRLYVIG